MQITIEVPVALRQYCAGARDITINDPAGFPAVIQQLTEHHPHLARRLVAPSGAFYDFVGVFLNQQSVAGSPPERIVLRDGDVVSLIPAMAGG